MKILIHEAVFKDVKKCCRKKWYLGLDKEFPRVVRLLQIKGSLPGEAPFHYLPEELKRNVLHARICLPDSGISKKSGPRIIYHINRGEGEVKILYVGGHKDRVYNTTRIVDVLTSRFISEDFIPQRNL